MVCPVLAADQCAHVTIRAVRSKDVSGLIQLERLPLQTGPQTARVLIVEDDAGVGGRPRIVWQQCDFGQATQHDQVAIAARSDAYQCRARPCVDQPAARPSIEDRRRAVGGVDQTGATDAVVAGENRGDLCTVPTDQLGGAVRQACGPHVDAPCGTVVRIGGDDPDLSAAAAVGGNFAGQPMTVGRVHDAGNRTLDGQFDVS